MILNNSMNCHLVKVVKENEYSERGIVFSCEYVCIYKHTTPILENRIALAIYLQRKVNKNPFFVILNKFAFSRCEIQRLCVLCALLHCCAKETS